MGAATMPTALQRQTQNLEGYGTPVYGCQTLYVIGSGFILLEELPTGATAIFGAARSTPAADGDTYVSSLKFYIPPACMFNNACH